MTKNNNKKKYGGIDKYVHRKNIRIKRTIRNIPDSLEDFVTAQNKENKSLPK